MNAESLKNSILQLAIQGKLVEQREEEGTAEELYKEIQQEKEKLIEEGKIRRQKKLPDITEEEFPFEIPNNWRWVYFSEVLDVRDGTHDTPKYVEEGVPLITSKNLVNGEIDFENVKYISEEDAEHINKRSSVDINDILFAMIGSIGNPVLVKEYREFSIKNVALFKPYKKKNTYMEYILWFLELTQTKMRQSASGAVQSFVSLTNLRGNLLPLPPLAEQKRIVEKIEELMPLVERYGKAYEEVTKLNNNFPTEMEKSILQYAIQGKLVEQREEEGTAEDLYKQIQLEKEKLIEEGKIKRQKKLPEIKEEEIPFEIPETWKWVRLNDLVKSIRAGGDKPKEFSKEITTKHTIPVIGNGKVNDGIVGFTDKPTVETSSITISGRGTIGYSSIRDYPFCPIVRLIVLDVSNKINMKFLQKAILNLLEVGVGTSIKQLTVPMIRPKLIPLPPLEEQKRIVARIEELLEYTHRLKKE